MHAVHRSPVEDGVNEWLAGNPCRKHGEEYGLPWWGKVRS